MRRLALLLVVLTAAGCGGSNAPKPEHATLTRVDVQRDAVTFSFDSEPGEIAARYEPRRSLAECRSGFPVRPAGSAFLVVHFRPAQTRGVPKRIVMPSGPVREASKVCDFEADVAWALGVDGRLPYDVSRDGRQVTVTFGG
jgi:hypothetical protein